ncbi:PREDICTED: uncharacterized protein LOC108691230 [Atta colombica]|uniref:uncharacterized protein LOC108691230 n=1 Tax=Atta colombica TaxID=520822 RepID=UPI00084BC804|nr:PREDICTED: uncharacterized protein LOC108691230 [Atta colombica]
MELTYNPLKDRNHQKYIKLVPHKNLQPSLFNVKNLSNKDLSQDIIFALAKGPNFTMALRKIPQEEIISQIESTDFHQNKQMKTIGPSRPYRDTDIIVLPVDKGNTTVVVMNTSDYKKKMKNLLSDKAYKKLDKNPTNIIAQNKILVKKSNISSKTKSTLILMNPFPPRLYGLSKIYKQNIPFRLIVSAIHSLTYNLSCFLA